MLILSGLVAILLTTYFNWNELLFTYHVMKAHPLGQVFVYVGKAVFFICLAEIVWRMILVNRYRPTRTCRDKDLPSITVIVPAYNEGRGVLRTLRSLAASRYPADKLQIIAIDDGSRDDTWEWILRGASELGGNIVTIRQPQNRGKRHALYAGFMQAQGEIVVTVDSDSLVERQTLRRLVSPFHNQPQVGAVAGNIRVLNRHEGVIPQMLDVSFVYSFDFVRASQSMVNTVACTPGALSAYRKDVVLKVLPEWVNQTFCGRTANIAEDRSLTNFILREGYYIRFQRTAVAYTAVPTTFKPLCKMYIRWARGDVRESLVMATFLFRKFRDGSALGARVNLLLAFMNFTVSNVLLAALGVCLLWQPEPYLINVLFGSLIASVLPAATFAASRRGGSDWLWAFAYSLFYVAGLAWIGVYSLFTPHKDRWLTRELPAPRSSRTASSVDSAVLVPQTAQQTVA